MEGKEASKGVLVKKEARNTIHGPTYQKKVSQHPGRFWMLTCFDDSC